MSVKNADFKPGQVVILRSNNSVKLVVTKVPDNDSDYLTCYWYNVNSGKIEEVKIPAAAVS